MRIAYFGYDFFAGCLEALIGAGHDVRAVFVPAGVDNVRYDFDTRVRSLAKQCGAAVYDDQSTLALDVHRLRGAVDLLVSAGFTAKIPVGVDGTRGVNVHPSLLPEGRGRWPLPWTILRGCTQSGVSIHKLTSTWDKGDVLLQRSISVLPHETLESLSARLQMAAPGLLVEAVADLPRYWDQAAPQSSGSYWSMPTITERTIDWQAPVAEIDRLVRAFGKFGSYAVFEETEWLVQDAMVWQEAHAYAPGTVVHRTSKETVLAAVDGFVCLRYYEVDPDFLAAQETQDA